MHSKPKNHTITRILLDKLDRFVLANLHQLHNILSHFKFILIDLTSVSFLEGVSDKSKEKELHEFT